MLAFGRRLVAPTRGANRAVARSRIASVDVPGMPVTVADTVGGGDTADRRLGDERALGQRAERDLGEEVLQRSVTDAVAASAVARSRAGAVPQSRREVAAQLRAASVAAP
jgi:fructokinase